MTRGHSTHRAANRQRPYLVSVDEIARGLEGRVLELVQSQWQLDGQIDGNNFVACNPLRLDRSPGSFMVGIDGPYRGLVRDFASGQSWSLLQFTAEHAFAGDIGAAIKWAKGWLGLDGQDAKALQVTRRAIAADQSAAQGEARAKAERTRRLAHRRYLEATADLRDTPVDRYLLGRGIDIRAFDFPLGSLRYHPALWNEESGQSWPAMVAAIVNSEGQHIAAHRTWLQVHDDGSVTKAPLAKAKKVLGASRGGLIRLWAGRTIDPDTGEIRKGRKLALCKGGVTLELTEGIEDGLSVALAMPEARVCAGISISNVQSLKVPPQVDCIAFWRDNDAPGSEADHGFQKVVQNIRAQGKRVRIVRPPAAFKDINAFLQSLRRAGGGHQPEQEE